MKQISKAHLNTARKMWIYFSNCEEVGPSLEGVIKFLMSEFKKKGQDLPVCSWAQQVKVDSRNVLGRNSSAKLPPSDEWMNEWMQLQHETPNIYIINICRAGEVFALALTSSLKQWKFWEVCPCSQNSDVPKEWHREASAKREKWGFDCLAHREKQTLRQHMAGVTIDLL